MWPCYVAQLALELDGILVEDRGHGVIDGYLREAPVAEMEGWDPVCCTNAALYGAAGWYPFGLGVRCRLSVLQPMHCGSPSLIPLCLCVSVVHFISFLACADVIGNVSEAVMRGVALFTPLGWWYVDISPPSIRPGGGWGLGSKDGTGVILKPLAPMVG